MRVRVGFDEPIELGAIETTPTIGIVDFSKRVTDAFGVTRVVERAFSQRLSVKLVMPSDTADDVQSRLVSLRATTGLWVADDQLRWLSVPGFYRDFEINHALPPVSYCTLTVESLAELTTMTDPGGDPAPFGANSSLQLVHPVTLTSAMLIASSVPENDAPAWLSGATYAAGARVISPVSHRIYESLSDANTANDPASGSDKWLEVGATNRWSMFDEALGSATSGASPLSVTLEPGVVDALALLDTVGTSVRVQATGYDHSVALDGSSASFLDLPADGGRITVTLTGSGTVAIGTLLVGRLRALGITEAEPTSGITDFSRKDRDTFGEITLIERAWAKRMTAKALIRTDAVDAVADRLATVRARPVLWIADRQRESLQIYGFVKDWSIEVSDLTSKLSLSIEGLSKANPAAATPVTVLTPAGDYVPSATYRAGYVVQFEGSSWVYVAADGSGNAPPHLPTEENAWWRVFARAGSDGAPGTPGRNGLDGTDGLDGTNGLSIHIAYADSADGAVNFTTGDAGGRAYVGVYSDQNAGADSANPASYGWTRLRGYDGSNGLPGPGGYVHIAYANSADGTVDFHPSDPTNRIYLGTYTDQTLPDSNDPAKYSWSLIKGADGPPGVSPAVLDLSVLSISIQATSTGVTKTGQLPKTSTVSVKQGTADITAACTLTLTSSNSSAIAASIALTTPPTISVSQADAAGYVDVFATHPTLGTIGTKRIAIARVQDAPTGDSAANASRTDAFGVGSGQTSFNTVPDSPTVLLKTDANGQLRLTVDATYYTQFNSTVQGSSFQAAVKGLIRVAGSGSSFSDFGVAATGSTSSYTKTSGEASEANVRLDQLKTALTANTLYELGFTIRKAAGLGSFGADVSSLTYVSLS